MKKIIYIIIALVIAYAGWLANKFIKAYRYLAFAISSVKLPRKSFKEIVMDFLDGYANLIIKMELGNFSNTEFEIDNYYIELYTPDGRFVAEPENPQDIQPIKIAPKEKKEIAISYGIDLAGAAKLFSQIPGDTSIKIKEAVTNYYKTGEFGIEILLTGYFKIKGMPFSVPVNYKTTI